MAHKIEASQVLDHSRQERRLGLDPLRVQGYDLLPVTVDADAKWIPVWGCAVNEFRAWRESSGEISPVQDLRKIGH